MQLGFCIIIYWESFQLYLSIILQLPQFFKAWCYNFCSFLDNNFFWFNFLLIRASVISSCKVSLLLCFLQRLFLRYSLVLDITSDYFILREILCQRRQVKNQHLKREGDPYHESLKCPPTTFKVHKPHLFFNSVRDANVKKSRSAIVKSSGSFANDCW